MIDVCGEQILVPAGTENRDYSKVISLNDTAAELWKKASYMKSFTIEDMVQMLLDEYEVEESVAREDCEKIVERWKEMELIEE